MTREELVVAGHMKYLMTGRINQGCIENFFSQIRGRGGHRYNPSSKDFRSAYHSLCCRLLLSPVPSANCDSTTVPLLCASTELRSASTRTATPVTDNVCTATTSASTPATTSRAENALTASMSSYTASGSISTPVISSSDFDTSVAVANVLQYVSGFVLSKLKCVDCADCSSALLTTSTDVVTERQQFMHFKAYSHRRSAFCGLTVPSETVMLCMQLMHNIFEQNIYAMLGETRPLCKLQQKIMHVVPFDAITLCSVHSEQAVNDLVVLFLCCRLHYFMRFETQRLLQPRTKGCSTSRVVQRKARCVLHN